MKAAAYGRSSGDYTLQWATERELPDDHANTFERAMRVTLGPGGEGRQSGVIGRTGDVDMFRFVAPITGRITIAQNASDGSRLDPYLYVYNSARRELARNDDSAGSLNSRVTINVTAGQTYYVKAAAYGRSLRAYSLEWNSSTDDGDNFNAATPITLTADGSDSRRGAIDPARDLDFFRFVAPVSGTMTVGMSAAGGGRLDTIVSAFDGARNLLAINDDIDLAGGNYNSEIQIDVTAGQTYFIAAAGYGSSVGDYVLQIATEDNSTPDPDPDPNPGEFDITLDVSGGTEALRALVRQAADRWERMITGDLPDVSYGGTAVDDVLINVRFQDIDGTSGILGWAGPRAFRSDATGLPLLGEVTIDVADAARMNPTDVQEVIEHEMAHVFGLGISRFWSRFVVGAEGSNPGFTGPQALAEYRALGNSSATAVPVEGTGGTGTRLAHWRESTFGTEAMTGWHNSGTRNPLSRVTLASLADIGYRVNLAAADSYRLPATTVELAMADWVAPTAGPCSQADSGSMAALAEAPRSTAALPDLELRTAMEPAAVDRATRVDGLMQVLAADNGDGGLPACDLGARRQVPSLQLDAVELPDLDELVANRLEARRLQNRTA